MRRGPLYMILASLAFTVMIGAVKVARREMTPFEVITWRCMISVPLALAFCWKPGIAIHNRAGMALRGLFGFGAMSCFFTAAGGLDLADLSIIGKLQPILIAIAAPLVLGAGERSRGLLWLVLLAGIGGSALVIGPDLQVGSMYGLWALGATAMSAGAHLAVRALGRTEEPHAVVFWLQVMVLVLSVGATVVTTGRAVSLPPAHLWPYLVGCGVTATVGQVLMTRAYKLDRAAPVAAASYTGPLFALVGDIVAFGRLPTVAVLLGGALVVGAGLVLVFAREPSPATEPAE